MNSTNLKLERTLLSNRPESGSEIVSLAGILVLVMCFAIDQNDLFGLSRYLTGNFNQVFTHHEIWRAFTASLVHADVEHLGSNALFFAGLSYLLSGYFGIWAFPVLSFLAGGLINLFVLSVYPPDVTVLGASGIVYFMASFWLTLYFAIERGLSKTRRLLNTLAFATVLFVPEVLHENVSYLSHTAGFALGIISGVLFFLIKRNAIRKHEVWSEVESDDCLAA